MADYDFGSLASPVKKTEQPNQKYDFGSLSTPKENKLDIPKGMPNQYLIDGQKGIDQWKKEQELKTQQDTENKNTPLWKKALNEGAGIVDTGLTVGSNALLGGLVAPTAAAVGGAIGGKKKQDEYYDAVMGLANKPSTTSGQRNVEKIGDVAEKTQIGNLAGNFGEMSQLGSAAKNIKNEAPLIRNNIESVKQVTAPIVKPVANAIGSVVKPIVDKIPTQIKLTPEMADLNAAAKRMGITLAPDQVSKNPVLKVAGSESRKIPGSGSKEKDNNIAWQKQMIKEIGGNEKSDRLNSTVYDQALRKSGSGIGRIVGKNEFSADKKFLDGLVELQNEVIANDTQDTGRIFNNRIGELYQKLSDGKMNGVQFRKFNTEMTNQIKSTQSPDLKMRLNDLQDSLLEQFNKNLTGQDAADLAKYRKQYAIAKTIAPIVGGVNGVNPTALRNAIRSTKAAKELYARGRSSLKDLADVGDLLKDPNSSGTAERNLVYKIPAAVGAAVAAPVPAAFGAATGYGLANMYNRYGHHLIPDLPK